MKNLLTEEFIAKSNEWIPVNIGLPEPAINCLVTVHHLDYEEIYVISDCRYNPFTEKWFGGDGVDIDDNIKVLAWMPVPNPYLP